MLKLTRRSRNTVVVLGAGPAGLLAAHAAEQLGYRVEVLSASGEDPRVARKSELHGCQYLHSAIPGLTGSAGRAVRYTLSGSTEGYRRKVYGENWQGQVSPDEYGPEGNHLAWDLRKAYDELWSRWAEHITPMEMHPGMVRMLLDSPSITILSTIPAPALCLDMENHKFASQRVWAMGTHEASYRWTEHPMPETVAVLPYRARNMTVECNGHRDTGWYRAATVFGASTLEWPGERKPPVAGVVLVNKPLSTDCTCHENSGQFYRLGRFGQWRKGVLVHEAYFRALEILK